MPYELGSITQVGGTVTAPKYLVTDQGTGVTGAVIENGTTNAAGYVRGGIGTASPVATWDVRGHNGNLSAIQARSPVKSYTITNRSRTSNVATVTIGNHGFQATEQVTVTGVTGDTTFQTSSASIISVTATTISYANTGSDVASTSSTGTAAVYTTADIQQWVNQSNVTVASVGYTGIITGIGSGLTALNGSNISTGTVAIQRGGTAGSSAVTGIDNLMTQSSTILGAATTDLSTATGQFVVITNSGTPTITAFGTLAAGAERVLQFSGAASITHNATSLILPGAANITVASGDRMILRSLGSGNWICIAYTRASAPPVSGTNTGDQTITLTGDVTGSGTSSFATTIAANAVTSAKFRQSTGLSVVGNPASGSANVSDITAGVTGGVLQSSGTALSFALVGSGNIAANAVTDAKLRQGAALSVIGNAANATANVADITAASDNQVLRRSGTVVGFGAVSLASSSAVTGTLPTANLPMAAASDMEGLSSTTVVSASVQQRHPGHPKAWAYITISGTTATVAAGYGVASCTFVSTGAWTVTWSTAFSSGSYCVLCNTTNKSGVGNLTACPSAGSASGSQIVFTAGVGTLTDPTSFFVAAFGDQ